AGHAGQLLLRDPLAPDRDADPRRLAERALVGEEEARLTRYPVPARRSWRAGTGPRCRSGDVVHGVGDLDLVPGVTAEQIAVLVAEVRHDRVTLAGDVRAGAGLVLDRRAGRRVDAVQVGRRRGRLEEQVPGLRGRVARVGQVRDRGVGLGLRPAGDEEDRVAVAGGEADQARHVEHRRERRGVDEDRVAGRGEAELVGDLVVVGVEQGVVDVEHAGGLALAVLVVDGPGQEALGAGHDVLHLLGVVAAGRGYGHRAHHRERGAGRAVVVLDLVLEHRDVHLGVAVYRREGVLGLDLGRLLLDGRRPAVTGRRAGCRERSDGQADGGYRGAGQHRQGPAEPAAFAGRGLAGVGRASFHGVSSWQALGHLVRRCRTLPWTPHNGQASRQQIARALTDSTRWSRPIRAADEWPWDGRDHHGARWYQAWPVPCMPREKWALPSLSTSASSTLSSR